MLASTVQQVKKEEEAGQRISEEIRLNWRTDPARKSRWGIGHEAVTVVNKVRSP